MNILQTLGRATGSIGKVVVTTALKGTGSFMTGFSSSFKAPEETQTSAVDTPTNYVQPAPEQSPAPEQAQPTQHVQAEFDFQSK